MDYIKSNICGARKRLGFGLALTVIALSCGQTPQSISSSQALKEDPTAMFVVMGGYNSCQYDSDGVLSPREMEMYAHMSALRLNVQNRTGIDVRWVASCFDTQGNTYLTSYKRSTISVYSSEEQEDVYNHILDLAAQYNSRKIMIVGHSHGGWLALKLAAHQRTSMLTQSSRARIGALVTIDPISYEYCWPSVFALASMWNNTVGTGCREAPHDINRGVRRKIYENLGSNLWSHYYQTNFWPVRSDAFEGQYLPDYTRDLTDELGFADQWPVVVNAHARIDNDEIVWGDISEQLYDMVRNIP
jgi:hypothetical protein